MLRSDSLSGRPIPHAEETTGEESTNEELERLICEGSKPYNPDSVGAPDVPVSELERTLGTGVLQEILGYLREAQTSGNPLTFRPGRSDTTIPAAVPLTGSRHDSLGSPEGIPQTSGTRRPSQSLTGRGAGGLGNLGGISTATTVPGLDHQRFNSDPLSGRTARLLST